MSGDAHRKPFSRQERIICMPPMFFYFDAVCPMKIMKIAKKLIWLSHSERFTIEAPTTPYASAAISP